MLITSLFLKGYKPLALNNIQSIQLDIQSTLTLILGISGSGKSSLLKELHPFPAIPGNYEVGGEKIIEIEHNQNQYKLISTLGSSGKHTFIKNGIEIHSNVTASQQTELVLKEFQYSLLAHKLLIGEMRFTELTPQERRDLLTTISPLDLRYAIKLHGTIKEQVRDQTAILKHLTQKSADVKLQLRELNISDDLIQHRTELESQLNALIPFASHPDNDASAYLYQLNDIEDNLNTLKVKISRIKDGYIPIQSIYSIQDLTEYLGVCSGHITSSQSNINNANIEIENLTQLTHSLLNNTLTKEEIESHILQTETQLALLTETCFVDSKFDIYLEYFDHLVEALEIIFDMNDGIEFYTQEERDTILKTEIDLKQEIAQLNATLISYQAKYKHLTEVDVLMSCPKCQHQFRSNGDSQEDPVEKINSLIQQTENKIIALKTLLEKHQVKINFVQTHQQMVVALQNLKRSSLLPSGFWEQFESNTIIVSQPNRTRNTIELWKANLRMGLQRFNLTNDLHSYQNSLKLFNEYGGTADKRVIELQQLIHEEFDRIDEYTEKLQNTKQAIQVVQQYEEALKQAETLLVKLDDVTKKGIDASIRYDAKQRCESIYNELAETSNIVNKQNQLIQSITELEDDLVKVLRKQKALIVLEENLSQTKGLIADQMLGYVENYIEQMNEIIDLVWEYPLKIVPCDMDNGNMSYVFPIKVNNAPVPDIKHLSKGQSEIVDLAFIMVMRSYLNICHYPIYFDEAGATFDDLHRLGLLRYIKDIIDTKQCSQVFMVNHYAVWNNSFNNHSVVVLDNRNITIPDKHNEYVTITFKES